MDLNTKMKRVITPPSKMYRGKRLRNVDVTGGSKKQEIMQALWHYR